MERSYNLTWFLLEIKRKLNCKELLSSPTSKAFQKLVSLEFRQVLLVAACVGVSLALVVLKSVVSRLALSSNSETPGKNTNTEHLV